MKALNIYLKENVAMSHRYNTMCEAKSVDVENICKNVEKSYNELSSKINTITITEESNVPIALSMPNLGEETATLDKQYMVVDSMDGSLYLTVVAVLTQPSPSATRQNKYDICISIEKGRINEKLSIKRTLRRFDSFDFCNKAETEQILKNIYQQIGGSKELKTLSKCCQLLVDDLNYIHDENEFGEILNEDKYYEYVETFKKLGIPFGADGADLIIGASIDEI